MKYMVEKFKLNLNFVWYTDGQIRTKEPNE